MADKDNGKEYNAEGKPEEGGGYTMQKGKLCKMAKSEGAGATGLSEEDLQKGLDRLDEFVAGHDATTRKEQLLNKALETELDESERHELMGLMSGAAADIDTLAEEISKSVESNEVMQQAFDVSEYLQEQNQEMVKSLTAIADRVESLAAQQQEFNLVLAKAMSDQGKLTKSMSERMGVIASQPARAPKSRIRPDQVLSKSFEGGGNADDPTANLSKSQVLDHLEEMSKSSITDGRQGLSKGGEDLTLAIATFEQTNQITPSLLNELRSNMASR